MEPLPPKFSESGLYSQATFKILTKYELTRAQRYPNPVTLLHISLNLREAKLDISESVKRLFAEMLNSSLRASDIPAYYGDDYLVLMPATDNAGGRTVAQRLITKLRGTRNFADGKAFRYKIHIGIATHPGGQDISADFLLEQAASALEKAKRAGEQEYASYQEKG